MKDVVCKMKDGHTWIGPLWEFRAKEGWMRLVLDIPRIRDVDSPLPPEQIYFRDVVSAVNKDVWISHDKICDVDLLKRARDEGWDGT